jgi:hypothetical protein
MNLASSTARLQEARTTTFPFGSWIAEAQRPSGIRPLHARPAVSFSE